MAKAGKHGVTASTPKNILFGAGTIHKNLKYSSESTAWNLDDSIIGATSGGSKLSIVPEFLDIEVDGALVATKELKQKIGETATLEINFAEITKDIVKMATIGKNGTSEDNTYDLIESKPLIESGDWLDNIAFVGQTLDGRKVIAILENALCTSGFETEGKNKEGSVGTYTFTSHGDFDSDLDTLPWKIYFPKATA